MIITIFKNKNMKFSVMNKVKKLKIKLNKNKMIKSRVKFKINRVKIIILI